MREDKGVGGWWCVPACCRQPARALLRLWVSTVALLGVVVVVQGVVSEVLVVVVLGMVEEV